MHISLLGDYNPEPEKLSPAGGEPRVLTEDVAAVLEPVVRPDDEDSGSSVALIAEKANTSTRTVYRVLSRHTETVSMDLADRLCLAVGEHLCCCRIRMNDGTIQPYVQV